MAKDFALAFYASRAWEETREAYGRSVFWVCERCEVPGKIVHHREYLTAANICDPEITLCWDNLECLCQDCHNKEHDPLWRPCTREGFEFNQEGELVASPPISET